MTRVWHGCHSLTMICYSSATCKRRCSGTALSASQVGHRRRARCPPVRSRSLWRRYGEIGRPWDRGLPSRGQPCIRLQSPPGMRPRPRVSTEEDAYAQAWLSDLGGVPRPQSRSHAWTSRSLQHFLARGSRQRGRTVGRKDLYGAGSGSSLSRWASASLPARWGE